MQDYANLNLSTSIWKKFLFQSYSKTMLLKITKLMFIYNDEIGD